MNKLYLTILVVSTATLSGASAQDIDPDTWDVPEENGKSFTTSTSRYWTTIPLIGICLTP